MSNHMLRIPPMLFLFFFACSPVSQQKLDGLWQLEEMSRDDIQRNFEPTFIQFKSNNVFSVSRVSGDIVGIYAFKTHSVRLISNDAGWFNTTWQLKRPKGGLILEGLEFEFRTTKMRFKRIEQIPNFVGFEEKLKGRWRLYKVREANKVKKVTGIWFYLDGSGDYEISEMGRTIDSGSTIIDTRHQKVVFENEGISWRAWFYGDELRLSNEELKLQYDLKRDVQ